jgi:WD40 repeat protein
MAAFESSLHLLRDKIIQFIRTAFDDYLKSPNKTFKKSTANFSQTNSISPELYIFKKKKPTLPQDDPQPQTEFFPSVNEQPSFFPNNDELSLKNPLPYTDIRKDTNEIISQLKQLNANIIKEQNRKTTFKDIQKIISIQNGSPVFSIIELPDTRIAISDSQGSIKIYSLNLQTKTWNADISVNNAHNDSIFTLCVIAPNTIASGSKDRFIKIWTVTDNTLLLKETLYGHSDSINKIISLSHKRFASGSTDKTIKIWHSEHPYSVIKTLEEECYVSSLIQLRNKEKLVNNGKDNGISFWNTSTYKKEHSVKYDHFWAFNGIIELPNDMIAVSSGQSSKITIIDTVKYVIVKEVLHDKYIEFEGGDAYPSALFLYDNNSFIYVHQESLVQISTYDFEILYQTKLKDEFKGFTVLTKENGRYMLTPNVAKGISIFKMSQYY